LAVEMSPTADDRPPAITDADYTMNPRIRIGSKKCGWGVSQNRRSPVCQAVNGLAEAA